MKRVFSFFVITLLASLAEAQHFQTFEYRPERAAGVGPIPQDNDHQNRYSGMNERLVIAYSEAVRAWGEGLPRDDRPRLTTGNITSVRLIPVSREAFWALQRLDKKVSYRCVIEAATVAFDREAGQALYYVIDINCGT